MLRVQKGIIIVASFLIFFTQATAAARAHGGSISASDSQAGYISRGVNDVGNAPDKRFQDQNATSDFARLGDMILNYTAVHSLERWRSDPDNVINDSMIIVMNETIRMAGLEFNDALVRHLMRRLYRYQAIQEYKQQHILGLTNDGNLYLRINRSRQLGRAELSRVQNLISDENADREMMCREIERQSRYGNCSSESGTTDNVSDQDPGDVSHPIEGALNEGDCDYSEADSAALAECRIGDMMYRAGNYREARRHYQASVDAVSDLWNELSYRKAMAEVRSGDTVAGAADLLSLVEHSPQYRRVEQALRQAAALYMMMRPVAAANELSHRDDIIVIRIFSLLPERNVSAILAEMDPHVAAVLMRKMMH